MKLNTQELAFLSAWAREEKAVNPYVLPAHKLQAAHNIRGVTLIRAIKAWARTQGCRDEEIFHLSDNSNPSWPWSSEKEMTARLSGIAQEVHTPRQPTPPDYTQETLGDGPVEGGAR